MVVLVESLDMEEMGWDSHGGDRAFALPVEGWDTVHFGENSALVDVVVLGGSLVMEKTAGQFEILVGDGTLGGADQVILDRGGNGACQRSGRIGHGSRVNNVVA